MAQKGRWPSLQVKIPDSQGDAVSAQIALQGAPGRALLTRRRTVGALAELEQTARSSASSAGQSTSESTAIPAEDKQESKLQELWNKESKFRLRCLPPQRRGSDLQQDSYEVGMVRLVNSKVREARALRASSPGYVPSKTLRQLGSDMQHSVRVCSKAQDFLDIGLDKVLEGRGNASLASPELLYSKSPLSAKTPDSTAANIAWDELLRLLKTPKSLSKSLSGSTLASFPQRSSSASSLTSDGPSPKAWRV
jgi:hypothetical protein